MHICSVSYIMYISNCCILWPSRPQHTWLAICEGNPSLTGGFPSQRSRYIDDVSISSRHRIYSRSSYTVTFTDTVGSRTFSCMAAMWAKIRDRKKVWRKCSSGSGYFPGWCPKRWGWVITPPWKRHRFHIDMHLCLFFFHADLDWVWPFPKITS